MFEISILLFPLLGIAFPIYIFVIYKLIINRNNKIFFSKSDLFFLVSISLYFIIRSFYVSFDALFYIATYYFGFILFYFYFKISKRKLDLMLLIKVLCLEVLLEAILINTILPAKLLPNYPAFTEGSPHYKLFFNIFQRPYSIGSNATVTSTLILILYIYVKSNFNLSIKLNLLVFGALLVSLSGTGIALYFIYITFSYFKPSPKSLFIFISLFILSYFLVQYLETSDFSKFSSIYLNQLFELKFEQIDNYLKQLNDAFQIYFGKNHQAKMDVVTFNDFSINDAFYNLGLLGLVIYLLFIFSNINSKNYVMILFFLIAAFHYGAIFNIIGQFLLGYILNIAVKIKNENDLKINYLNV